MLGPVALSAAALLLATVGADAASGPPTGKCSAAKIKCATNRATAILGCHNKAETKNLPVDSACISKADTKFTMPVKGCMEKAEAKPPCATTGDAATLQSQIDDFVVDVVTALDPGYPTPVLNKCSAGKKKCVANQQKAILACYGKAASGGLAFDPALNPPPPNPPLPTVTCLQKARDKFADPIKGCFAKLEAKPPCLTTNDTAALEAKVDDFALATFTELLPHLDFTLRPAGGVCGNIKDITNTVLKPLTCGGLNIGGGSAIVPEGPTPDGSTSRFSLNCDATGACALGPVFTAGSNFDCTAPGCRFGTPLEIPNPMSAPLTTCVMNTWAASASGTVNRADGTSITTVPLNSDIYTTGNVAQPCPRCYSGGVPVSGSPSSPATGTCDRGPSAGLPCTSQNSVGLTNDCLTGGMDATHPCGLGQNGPCIDGAHVGPINVNLKPLTTGQAQQVTAAGLFCANQANVGCFGNASCRTITENGSPAGPVAKNTPADAILASVFCIQKTGLGLVDSAASLPGPGAISLPGTFVASE
jgi:hypothetical protein